MQNQPSKQARHNKQERDTYLCLCPVVPCTYLRTSEKYVPIITHKGSGSSPERPCATPAVEAMFIP